jgi:DNA-binding protein Fis
MFPDTYCSQFDGRCLPVVIREVERAYLEWALTRARGNKTKAARLAGIKPDTFRAKLRNYTVTLGYRLE